MEHLAGVFFEVKALEPDAFLVPILALDLDKAATAKRMELLRDLESLGGVRR